MDSFEAVARETLSQVEPFFEPPCYRSLAARPMQEPHFAPPTPSGILPLMSPEQPSAGFPRTIHGIKVREHNKYEQLIAKCRGIPPVPTAVAHPCDEVSLAGAMDAAALGLISPILVGPAVRIRALAAKMGISLAGVRVEDQPHSHASAMRAVALVRAGEAELLMKGSLHTDELMHEVAARDTGLRTGRRMSHVFVMDVPTYPKPLFVTDAAINIFPTLEDKRDICQNAI